MKSIFLSTILIPLAATASAANFNGGDWGGQDLMISNGDTLSGNFTNVGSFTIPNNSTASINSNIFSVNARSINIAGTLNGSGAGYAGGLTTGINGSAGYGPGGGQGGLYGPTIHASGGGGGGSFGSGGNSGQYLTEPGYAPGGLGYISTDLLTPTAGSGGGSAGSHTGSTNGGDGGSGGAGISLFADTISISGSILAKGNNGESGDSAPTASSSSGGGGAGGTIILGGLLDITGVLDVSGGEGADYGLALNLGGGYGQGGGGGGGGLISLNGTFLSIAGTYLFEGGKGGTSDIYGNGDSQYFSLNSTNGANGAFINNASAVPVPAAAWLFGSALAGVGVVRRKKHVGK